MTLLLDTHAFLWFWWNDPRLSETSSRAMCDPTNRKLVSVASCWEVAIKVSLKKLDIGARYQGYIHQHMVRNNFELLSITHDHMALLAEMPFHHKDPFDRMLIAQARHDEISIVSGDTALDAYGVTRIW
ncbi:MAG TPA: type II toxin-antitoxin system VapC family toxin [Pirellulales bacterium]|nr:type II toxin-antitoxin system VapC family toxin [Pirellulales bacterium]